MNITISYNPAAPQSNQPLSSSSPHLPSPPPTSCLSDRRNNIETADGSRVLSPSQTLDQKHLDLHQHHLILQQQLSHMMVGEESVPDPDPTTRAASTAAASVSSSGKPRSEPEAQPPPSTATNSYSSSTISYRECLKNHAASVGGHVLDGCGEFMPSGKEGTPEALKCAACDCHRNFHRKEVRGESHNAVNCHNYANFSSPRSRTTSIHPAPIPPLLSAPPTHQYKYHHNYTHSATPAGSAPHLMVAFAGNNGGPSESSSEDRNKFQSNAGSQPMRNKQFLSASRKRFRTKFSQEQKERMQEFAERLGWRIQKQDEEVVQQFCNEVCVRRQVFKVWMHNNKQALKKKQP